MCQAVEPYNEVQGAIHLVTYAEISCFFLLKRSSYKLESQNTIANGQKRWFYNMCQTVGPCNFLAQRGRFCDVYETVGPYCCPD